MIRFVTNCKNGSDVGPVIIHAFSDVVILDMFGVIPSR